ncbi:hypothetical protein ACOT7R_09150 [Clostridium perfringens]|uniref:hypothetical protein n=1 Tax=Clostridium perfringens TaxID=1502 RepID=UPI003BAC7D6A
MNKNRFRIISRNTTLKPNIKIFYGVEDDWTFLSYSQTLKDCERLEERPILKIEDNYYTYKKVGNNWFRKRR